ncbi:DUF1501 domain-containing protein [Kiritimatiellota bacterium B12222]|nr:DUF1501 domain-containing protein [Kiritimatiellota bacterium B12222]
MEKKFSRRQFLGQAACAGLKMTGVLSTIGTLRLFNAAVAQELSGGDDYKSLICLFLYGGNDANNMLVPHDLSSYSSYQSDRGILALPREDLLSLGAPGDDGREFAFHPAMASLLPHFQSGKLAMVCNVGTLVAPVTQAEYKSGGAALPPHLFSHNDQQVQWQTSVPDSAKKIGWGGRLADMLNSLNQGSQVSMNISIAGSNFFQVGEEVMQYHVTPNGSIGLSNYDATWNPTKEMYHASDNMIGRSYGHLFEQEYASIMSRAVGNDSLLKNVLATVPEYDELFPLSTSEGDGMSNIAQQLRMILRMIKARNALGMRRQIFFASLGGFDTHDAQLEDHHGLMLTLSNALADFQTASDSLGLGDEVTLFTGSDFNRTYNSNGKGSDHAWGSHHMVMGGAVNGGDLYGQVPILSNGGPDDTGSRGSWIPKVSTDEMAATLALWFGVPLSSLDQILPNIGRFNSPDMGFMRF